jgi:hypothetical protein
MGPIYIKIKPTMVNGRMICAMVTELPNTILACTMGNTKMIKKKGMAAFNISITMNMTGNG